MDLFPSHVERTVAAALLLLSDSKSPSPSPIFRRLKEEISSEEEKESLSLFSTCSESKSKSSSITSDDVSSVDNRPSHKLRFVSHEIKFKVVKKRRSKVYWNSSDDRILMLTMPTVKTSRSESTEASCLSSNTVTSAASGTRKHYVTRGMQIYRSENRDNKVKRSKMDTGSISFSAHLRIQAEAILNLLSRGSLSEVRIREHLGDSPDTSKALRILLRREEIKRSGMGGRYDPYIYKNLLQILQNIEYRGHLLSKQIRRIGPRYGPQPMSFRPAELLHNVKFISNLFPWVIACKFN
ncbi:hypothetical protein M5689_014824 [Euphorbia peplus]|nr:hypothetical protein M5689_014824 [Euphorbia peplus]